MLHEVRKDRVRVPDRSVVDAAHDFLPETPLDPDYLEWLATKSEKLPRRPASYAEAPPRWATYVVTRRVSSLH